MGRRIHWVHGRRDNETQSKRMSVVECRSLQAVPSRAYIELSMYIRASMRAAVREPVGVYPSGGLAFSVPADSQRTRAIVSSSACVRGRNWQMRVWVATIRGVRQQRHEQRCSHTSGQACSSIRQVHYERVSGMCLVDCDAFLRHLHKHGRRGADPLRVRRGSD